MACGQLTAAAPAAAAAPADTGWHAAPGHGRDWAASSWGGQQLMRHLRGRLRRATPGALLGPAADGGPFCGRRAAVNRTNLVAAVIS